MEHLKASKAEQDRMLSHMHIPKSAADEEADPAAVEVAPQS